MEKHPDASRHCESLESGQDELLAGICSGGRRAAARLSGQIARSLSLFVYDAAILASKVFSLIGG